MQFCWEPKSLCCLSPKLVVSASLAIPSTDSSTPACELINASPVVDVCHSPSTCHMRPTKHSQKPCAMYAELRCMV